MKKLSLATLFCLGFVMAWAQVDSTGTEGPKDGEDGTDGKDGKRTITITFGDDDDEDTEEKEKEFDIFETRWLMLDLGKSMYLDDGSFSMSPENDAFSTQVWGSWNWSLHAVQQRIRLKKESKISLGYGLTFDFNRYKFVNNVKLEPARDMVTMTNVQDSISYNKNRLNATYLKIPLYYHFESNPKDYDRSFHLSIGIYGGILLSGRLRQESDLHGKQTFDDDFNLSKFRYGTHARIGFGHFTLYANYALNELFEEDNNNGIALQPLNVGITVIPF